MNANSKSLPQYHSQLDWTQVLIVSQAPEFSMLIKHYKVYKDQELLM